MYLFTRSRQVKPVRYMDALGWAGEVTASVRDVTGREVDAWAAVLSPEVGTLVWAMWAETLAEVVEAGDKLAASSAYNELVNRATTTSTVRSSTGWPASSTGSSTPTPRRPSTSRSRTRSPHPAT